LIIGLIAGAACFAGIWQAAKIGYARTISQDALRTNNLASANRAVQLSPSDAETHATRGLVLQRTGDYSGACSEPERAIQRRTRDYFLWLLLGVSRDLKEDQAGAQQAFRQAIALSPVYGKSHWLLGNLLLRSNQPAEAFQELRFAASSDETLLPNVIDLAWGIYRHDPQQTVKAIQPPTDNGRIGLAVLFARQGTGQPAIEQFRAARSPSAESLQKFMNELMQARLFPEAYEVWTRINGLPAAEPELLNPGFEDEIAVGQTGFGWQITENISNVTLSQDPNQYQAGKKSLHLDFHGDSNPATPLISQVLIVKPRTSYRLTFQALEKDFVSTGAPVLVI